MTTRRTLGESIGSIAPILVALAVALTGAAGAQVIPDDEDFLATEIAVDTQGDARLAARPDGGFTVLWQGTVAGIGLNRVGARRFDAAGEPIGGDVLLLPEAIHLRSVGSDAEGDLVVVWSNRRSGPGGTFPDAIRGRRFTPELVPYGNGFVVNSAPLSYNSGGGSVAVHPDGHFHVVWHDETGRGQRFGADGSRLGSNVELDGPLNDPEAASREAGGFVAVGLDFTPAGCADRLLARRFDLVGQPVGESALVAPVEACIVEYAIDSSAAGAFVVTWTDGEDDAPDVFARRFTAAGSPAGPAFRVNSLTAGRQSSPHVEVEPTGRFVVVWESEGSPGSDGDGWSVQARRFAGDGTPIGGQFQVNTSTAGDQIGPRALVDGSGRLVVAWTSAEIVGPSYEADVRARRFRLPFFADGFENGTTSRW